MSERAGEPSAYEGLQGEVRDLALPPIESWENQYGGVTASVGIGGTLDSADLEMYERKARRKQERYQARLHPETAGD